MLLKNAKYPLPIIYVSLACLLASIATTTWLKANNNRNGNAFGKTLPFLFISSASCNTNSTGNSANSSTTPAGSGNGVKAKTVTPEMFGAVGDGTAHKLSSKYQSLDAARRDFPGVKDLDITLDGAAFQKAIDEASKNGEEVDAEKSYVINYPLITRSNVVIDGKNKGLVYNDASRSKDILHWAFYFGNHSASAFVRPDDSSPGYKLYDVNSIPAGQNFATLVKASDASAFKVNQLVMVTSNYKRTQGEKKILLPYHITISKIIKIEGDKLYFEYPIDEQVSSAQIAANGTYDPLAEINFEGVDNVTLKNINVNAEHLTLRTYGYKCVLDHIKVSNGIRLIGLNAMAHSRLTNISGTFASRCIEIKTGSSDVLVQNITATYQPLPDFPRCIDAISLGQYCRNITIDSFNINIGNANVKNAIVDFHARKCNVTNGVVTCKNQSNSYVKFFNERYVSDPKFGCYANVLRNVKFYGGPNMRKNILDVGDDETDPAKIKTGPSAYGNNPNKTQKNKEKQQKNKNKGDNEQGDEDGQGEYTANTPPESNVIENCLFDGGSPASYAALNQGEQNIIRNCTFTKARIKVSPEASAKNEVSNNKEAN